MRYIFSCTIARIDPDEHIGPSAMLIPVASDHSAATPRSNKFAFANILGMRRNPKSAIAQVVAADIEIMAINTLTHM